jgi:hypothetical protein
MKNKTKPLGTESFGQPLILRPFRMWIKKNRIAFGATSDMTTREFSPCGCADGLDMMRD